MAVGVGLLLFIFLIVVFNACQDSRRKNSLRNYNRDAATVITQSDEVGSEFFTAMAQGASQQAEDLSSDISSLRATADTNLSRARELSTPGEVTGAQESLLVALELRRDALQYISGQITTALGNEGDVANRAIEGITGQMQAFLASDVLLRTRVTPLIEDALKDNDVVAEEAATRGFLPGFSWLQPEFVAEQLGTRLVNTGGGRGNEPIAPGLHGNGLTSTTINGVALTPGESASNRVPLEGDLAVVVEFANQGENTEFDIQVQVTMRVAAGTTKDITGKGTVDTLAAGESATVEIPLSQRPAAEIYVVNVEVKPVPGEKKTDNNKSTYNVLFE